MDTVDTLLNKQMQQIVRKAHQLEAWQQAVNTVLDPGLRPYVKVANFRGGCLVLMTDSAGWATRLKFSTPQILAGLKEHPTLEKVLDIKVIVRPVALPPKPAKVERHISKQSKQHIQNAAAGIQNQELKRALEKLGSD